MSALDLIQGRKGSINTAIISQQESNGICYGGLFKNALTTTTTNSSSLQNNTGNNEKRIDDNSEPPAILSLKFPFFELKPDQVMAVDAWLANQCRGSIIYGSGTGSSFNILILVPRIVLVEQNYKRLVSYGIPPEKIGRYFGELKEIREITISTYHSAIDNNKRILTS